MTDSRFNAGEERDKARIVLDRRGFLRFLSASVAAAGLSACSSTTPEPAGETGSDVVQSPTEAPTSVEESAPEARVLRVATWESGGLKESMDPAFNYQDSDATRCGLVYDRLFRIDPSFTPQPQLATEWESNETADVWTIKLREGVKFHDGKDFTAADVVYTFKRLLDPDLGSAAAANLSVLTVDGIEAIDDYTVRFTLPEPAVDLPLMISTRHAYIVPDGSASEDLTLTGVGTGPFRQVEFTPGELRSYFEKNEAYWEPGLPKVDAIELLSVTEGAARNSALQSGEIDLAMAVELGGLEAIQGDPNIHVISARSPYVICMTSWCDTPPFDDVRVRQAIKYCLDRDLIVETVALGHANVANDHPVAPWVRYAWQAEPRKQDYEKAKQLLADAGYGDGLDLTLYTGDASPGMVTLAQVVKEMAAPAGINIEVQHTPADTYWSEIWMQKPFHCGSWSGRPADEALFIAYYSKAEWNESHFYNQEFDDAILTARRTMDEAERTALYQKAQQILSEEGGTYIAHFMDSLAAGRSNVVGWEPHPTNYVKDFRNVAFSD